jgi:hypothetical protein
LFHRLKTALTQCVLQDAFLFRFKFDCHCHTIPSVVEAVNPMIAREWEWTCSPFPSLTSLCSRPRRQGSPLHVDERADAPLTAPGDRENFSSYEGKGLNANVPNRTNRRFLKPSIFGVGHIAQAVASCCHLTCLLVRFWTFPCVQATT